jgi:hypothetical protein
VGVTRATTRHLAVASVLALAFGCGGQTRGTGHGSQASAEFARVRAARAELLAAREALDRVQAEALEGSVDAERAMIVAEMSGAIRLRVPLKVDAGVGRSWLEAK